MNKIFSLRNTQRTCKVTPAALHIRWVSRISLKCCRQVRRFQKICPTARGRCRITNRVSRTGAYFRASTLETQIVAMGSTWKYKKKTLERFSAMAERSRAAECMDSRWMTRKLLSFQRLTSIERRRTPWRHRWSLLAQLSRKFTLKTCLIQRKTRRLTSKRRSSVWTASLKWRNNK